MGGNTDTRIVNMQFNNQQFERNIAKSTKSLNDFKEALNFDKVSGSLKSFFSSMKDNSIELLSSNVQKLADRFTGLGNVAEMVTYQIRQRIEGAISSMSRFVDSMTTAQIDAGKVKYEMLNKAVQTIKNATGMAETDVYTIMEKLNKYTDQTSYDFADMANNIGKFTSAGVKLDKAETAMEGIANWAALSGAGISEASRAMYNISQAMSVGKMTLMDWKSIENANMATVTFKQAAIDAAVASGDLVKSTDKDGNAIYKTAKKYGKQIEVSATKFNESLSKGWFTSDVMMSVLGEFGDQTTELGKKAYEAAQKCTTFTDVLNAWKDMISTGWMNSFRHIFGDLTESMNFFSDVCNKVSDDLDTLITFRNDLLKGWADLGGRTSLFASILGDYGEGVETGAYGLLDIIHDVGTLISDAFWDMLKVFAPGDVLELWDVDDGKWRMAWLQNGLKDFTDSIQTAMQSIRTFFTEDIQIGDQTTSRLEMIRSALRGIAGAFVFAYNVISGIVLFFRKIYTQLQPSFIAIEALFAAIGEAIYSSAGQEQKDKGILGFFSTLADLLSPLTGAINAAVVALVNLIAKIINFGIQHKIFEKIGNAIQKVFDILVRVLTPMVDFIGNVFDILGNLFEKGFTEENIKDAGKKLAEAFKTMFKTIVNSLPDSIGGIRDAIKDLFGLWDEETDMNRDTLFTRIRKFFENGFNELSTWFQGTNIFQTIKEKLFGQNGSNSEGGILSGILGWFDNLSLGGAIKGVLGGFVKVIGWVISQLSSKNLWTLAKAILGFVSAVKIYKMISSAQETMEAIGDFFKNPLKSLFGGGDDDDDGGGFLSTIVDKILDVAKAIALIAGAIIVLGAIPTGQLLKGGLALTAIMGLVVGFIAAINAVSGVGLKSAFNYIAIAGIAISIGLLVVALLPLAVLPWESLGKMLTGLGGIMIELVAFMMLTSYLPIGTGQLGSFIGFAASIAILVLTLLPLALLPLEGIGKMLAGLGGVMLELVGFMLLVTYLPIGTGSLGSFIGFAASIAILVLTLLPLANMPWEGLEKMAAGLAGVLLELVGFMLLVTYLSIGTGSLGGFIGFAASIAILVLSLLPLANLEWEQLGKMAAGLAGVLGELLLFAFLVKGIKLDPGSMAGMILFAGALAVIMLSFGAALAMAKGMDWGTIAAFAGGLTALLVGMAVAISVIGAIPITSALKGVAVITVAIIAIMGALAVMIPFLLGSIGTGMMDVSSKLELVSGMISGFADRMGSIDEGNIDKPNGIFDKLKVMMQKLAGWGKFTGSLDDFSYTMFALGTGMEIFDYHVGNVIGNIGGDADAALGFLVQLSECIGPLSTLAAMEINPLIGKISALGGALYIFAKGAKEAEGMEIGEKPDISGGLRLIQALAEALNENGGFTIPANMPQEDELSLFGAQLAALAAALVLFEEAGSGLGNGTEQALKTLDFFKDLKAKLISTEFKKSLGAAIGIFKEENVKKDELTQFGTNIEQLGLALKAFASSVTVIDESTGEMKELNFDNAIKALEAFAALDEKLGIDFGPVLQVIIGRRKDLGDLSAEIETLGTALSDFTGKLTGVDENGNLKFDKQIFEDALAVTQEIADYLTKLNGQFDTVGGLVNILDTALTGRDYDFTDIKTQMIALGDGLRGLGGINTNEENKIISAEDFNKEGGIADLLDSLIVYMKSLKTKIGKVGGVYNTLNIMWNGRDFNFTDLETQLKALGSGLNAISGLNNEGNKIMTVEETPAIFDLIDALLNYMGTLKRKAQPVGGLYNVVNTALNGRTFNFVDLETQLKALGSGLNAISGVNIDTEGNTIFSANGRGAAIDTIDALITYMMTLGTKIGRVGGLGELFENLFEGHEADFQYVGTQLGYLGEGMGKFSKGLNAEGTFDSAATTGALGALDHVVSIIQKMRTFSDEFYTVTDGINQYDTPLRMENLSEWVARMADLMHYVSNSTSVNPNAPSIINSLVDFIWGFDDALAEKGGLQNLQSPEILSQLTQSLVNLVTATKGLTLEDGSLADFSVIGVQICNGVISGIEQGQSSVSIAAKNMAIEAYNAAIAALEIGSPSKLFAEVGNFIAAGMAIGISDGSDNVSGAAEDMSEGALKGAAGVLSMMSSMLDDGLNPNPTISPVIDMDDVYAELDKVDKRFDTTGQFGKGNIDLNNRQVVHNDDGSISTERSFSVNIEGKEVLLPTVVNGKIVSEDEAIEHYFQTGEHLGKFDTWQEADAYAEMLHNRQDWYYNYRHITSGHAGPLDFYGIADYANELIGHLNTDEKRNQNEAHFTGIYERMDALSEKFNTMSTKMENLGTRISQMKLVLDSGVVAGGVTDGVDNNIGRKMFYASRNN